MTGASDPATVAAGLQVSRKWSAPHINRRHVDGPLLVYSDGQLHWLTWPERIALVLGRIDAETLQARRRPNLSKTLERNAP